MMMSDPRVRYCCLLLTAALSMLLWPAWADEAHFAEHFNERIEVRLEGLSGEALRNVQGLLSLVRAQQQAPQETQAVLSPPLIERLHQRGFAEIRRALEPFGYYQAQITGSLTPPSQPGQAWQAHYQITPGEPIPIDQIALRFVDHAQDTPLLTQLRQQLHSGLGKTLDHRRYEQGKQQLLQGLQQAGYLQAQFRLQRVAVDLHTYVAQIILHVETGPLLRVGEIHIEQEGFDEAYLRSLIPVRRGAPLTLDLQSELRHIFSASGYFAQVEIERLSPDPATPDLIPLLIRLQPLKRNRYRARLGWGTDSGVGTQLDWTRRYLWDRGHQMRLGGVWVEQRNKAALDFLYTLPADPWLGYHLELAARHQGKDLNYGDVSLDEGGQTRITHQAISLRLPRNRSLRGQHWSERLSLSWVEEEYDLFEVLFGNLPPLSQEHIASVLGSDRALLAPAFKALVPGIEWTYRQADNPLHTTHGNYLNLSLHGAHESLGSNVRFWQTRLAAMHIRPVFGNDRLIFRSDWGYTDATTASVLGASLNRLPEDYEFRTGGDRSVRGYRYESLLPREGITGGKHLSVISLEYERTLFKDFSAAAFVDGGNAFNDFNDMDIKGGIGLGLRWRSPIIGLVRLDTAVPLDEEALDRFRIHFTVGPEF